MEQLTTYMRFHVEIQEWERQIQELNKQRHDAESRKAQLIESTAREIGHPKAAHNLARDIGDNSLDYMRQVKSLVNALPNKQGLANIFRNM